MIKQSLGTGYDINSTVIIYVTKCWFDGIVKKLPLVKNKNALVLKHGLEYAPNRYFQRYLQIFQGYKSI